MVGFVKILLVAALATSTLSSGEETSAATTASEQKVEPKLDSDGKKVAAGHSGTQKPFFYGRKFELPKDSGDKKDKLYSPLITSPIRALPSFGGQNAEAETETVKHYQNEIYTNIRDLFRETTKGSFNDSHLSAEAREEENQGGKATTQSPRNDFSDDVTVSVSKSRRDGDRSLLVVFPFKAEGDDVEELFTKRPLVKVIESEEKDGGPDMTSLPALRREIFPTTEPNSGATGEPPERETTTENGGVAKIYTNYNDVESVTKKFDDLVGESQYLENHNFEVDLVTPYPVYKRWRNKTKKVPEQQTEEKDAAEEVSTTQSPKPKIKPKGKGQRRKSTTEGPPRQEELSKVLDVLPPDMKDVILRIGLNEEDKQEEANESHFRAERPPRPTIDPKSYSVFKPLPLEGGDENRNFVPEDMRDFLASFGLLPIGRREQKSLKQEPTSENKTRPVEDVSDVDLEFLPDDLKALLENMGLTKNEDKKEPTRIHIFNPSNHSVAHSEEDVEKLNAILSSIKAAVNKSQSLTPDSQSEIIEKIKELNNLRYGNGNLSEINNDIKKTVISSKINEGVKLKTTAKRATKLIGGPDPLMFGEESSLKNDVKRQSNSSSSASASSSSGDSSASADSSSSSASGSAAASASDGEATTEENPNIEALKESFGGGETASDDADIESSLPPKRPNGLYLLLDWNSFLEVGTEDDNQWLDEGMTGRTLQQLSQGVLCVLSDRKILSEMVEGGGDNEVGLPLPLSNQKRALAAPTPL